MRLLSRCSGHRTHAAATADAVEDGSLLSQQANRFRGGPLVLVQQVLLQNLDTNITANMDFGMFAELLGGPFGRCLLQALARVITDVPVFDGSSLVVQERHTDLMKQPARC